MSSLLAHGGDCPGHQTVPQSLAFRGQERGKMYIFICQSWATCSLDCKSHKVRRWVSKKQPHPRRTELDWAMPRGWSHWLGNTFDRKLDLFLSCAQLVSTQAWGTEVSLSQLGASLFSGSSVALHLRHLDGIHIRKIFKVCCCSEKRGGENGMVGLWVYSLSDSDQICPACRGKWGSPLTFIWEPVGCFILWPLILPDFAQGQQTAIYQRIILMMQQRTKIQLSTY